jgi:hypothetical protein
MIDGKELSEQIRRKKKGAYRYDMDYAGQDAVDPNAALDAKHDADVNETLGDPDHEPASPKEMGEDESSQELSKRKKISARINSYFDAMTIKK